MSTKGSRLLISLILIILFALSNCAQALSGNFIIKYIVPDRAGKLLFLGGKQESDNEPIKYNISRLTDPHRMVVDIENAVLEDEEKSLSELNQDIKISQVSKDPNIVRVVFTAKTAEELDKIKTIVYKNNISFEFDEIELAKIPVSSVYTDRNSSKTTEIQENNEKTEQPEKLDTPKEELTEEAKKEAILEEIKKKIEHNITINNAELRGNRVLISGIGIISTAEPFVLENPTRVIFDLTDAVLDSSELIKEFSLENNDTAKLAQFDSKTVRLVVKTENPENYISVLSPDLQSVIISPKGELSFIEFPNNSSTGTIKEIKIIKEDETTTKLVLISENPIIHNINRVYDPDKLNLNLFNIKKPLTELFEGLEKTGQYHGCQVLPIENFPNGSKWVFSLNKTTIIKTKLSLDGRILELTLQDDPVNVTDNTPKIKKKIVIDPGHGGYDPGAEYNGIYEKDLTLDIAKRVKRYLYEAGYYVIMTRETDKTLSLKERVAIEKQEDPDLFLSIHVNASRNPSIKGMETHWYTNQSRPLAIHVQDQMVNNLVTPDRGIKNSKFYVIRNSKSPAVLTEIGYMSNETELYQLMTEERKESTARAIAEGIMNYVKARNSEAENSGKQKL